MKKIWKNKKFFYGGQKIWTETKRTNPNHKPANPSQTNRQIGYIFPFLLPAPYLHSYAYFVPIYMPIPLTVQVYRSVTTITQPYKPLPSPPLFWSVESWVAFLQFFFEFFFGKFFFWIFFCRIPQGSFFPQGSFCGCGYFWESSFFLS